MRHTKSPINIRNSLIFIMRYLMAQKSDEIRKYSSSPIPPTYKLNTCKEIYNDFHQHLNVPSRARYAIISPKKPVNPALIRITACNQTGCECMVCTSNPSLMTGLSCPDIGSIKCNEFTNQFAQTPGK